MTDPTDRTTVASALGRRPAWRSGRTGAPGEAVANEIMAGGGVAETATVDALDATTIERDVAAVAGKGGDLDVMLNAVGVRAVQGVPLSDLAPNDFSAPIATWTTSQFLTARPGVA